MSTADNAATPSVYDDCLTAGLEIDSHESDLYVRDTPQAREILSRHRAYFEPFTGTDGAAWLDAPFLYLPFWRAKAAAAPATADAPECSCEPGSPYLCPSCERKAEEQPHGF